MIGCTDFVFVLNGKGEDFFIKSAMIFSSNADRALCFLFKPKFR